MTTTTVDAVRESVKDHVEPALKSLEHLAEGAAVQVRRRPLASVAVVGVAGVLAGCCLGLVLASRVRRS
jgi:ElaB/YqjD/DUF883 family membrane-anchored ribosome-binding protein